MSAEENITVVREMIAALDRSDWTAIEKHPGMGQTRKVHPMIHSIFPDYHHSSVFYSHTYSRDCGDLCFWILYLPECNKDYDRKKSKA